MEEHIDESELPPVATVDESGSITTIPLTEAYPDPSLDRVVMKLENHGTAPVDGKQTPKKIREAYRELGSWVQQHQTDTD